MVLQSIPPAFGPPAVLFAVLLVAGFILGATGSAVVRRLSNPVGKYRLFYLGILLPYTLLSYGVLALLAFGPALTATLPVATTGPVGTVVADFFGFLAAGLVWLAAYTPTIRGVRSVRDIDLSTRNAVARMARFILGASGILAVGLLPVRLWDVTESPIGLSLSALQWSSALSSVGPRGLSRCFEVRQNPPEQPQTASMPCERELGSMSETSASSTPKTKRRRTRSFVGLPAIGACSSRARFWNGSTTTWRLLCSRSKRGVFAHTCSLERQGQSSLPRFSSLVP